MQGLVRFSLFGNYERFSTSNIESYMKLINFFGQKGYKPATANELQLQTNGQSKILIMPSFFNESGSVVEIASTRINFQNTSNNTKSLSGLNEIFRGELTDVLGNFVNDMGVTSNRVALNCEIIYDDSQSIMPTQSTYFDDTNNAEMSVRNVARQKINNEECNIIIEKYVNRQNNFTKYTYDINSIGEKQNIRFDYNNIQCMYDSFIEIASDIEKGLK